MRTGSPKILIVDDDSDAALSLVKALKCKFSEVQFHAAGAVSMALQLFAQVKPHAVVLDLHLDEERGVESGFSLGQKFLALDPTARIIVLTGHSCAEHGVRALTLGAASFLEKPADVSHLCALLRDAVAQSELKRSFQALSREREAELSSVICGSSSVMQEVREAVVYAGQTAQAVLILGETGTGKGLCAWAIHNFGRRRGSAFVRYQPTFGTADLVNSDLFGHARGSFTGALTERRGLLAEADSGTLFLDEVEELPLETQVSLLGVIQEKRLRRVGCDTETKIDFRLISASNDDVLRGLESGKLRKDFYHRIAHFVITVPPLNQRKEDIQVLGLAALGRLREREQINVFEIDTGALGMLQDRDWPGNVRELEAVVDGAAYRASLAGRNVIEEQDFHSGSPIAARSEGGFHEKVEKYKSALVQEAMRANDGNQVHAARALGLDRSSLRRILARG